MKKGLLAIIVFCAFFSATSAEELSYLPANSYEIANNLNLSLSELDKTYQNLNLVLPPKNAKIHVNVQTQRMCIEAYGDECAKEYPVSTGASDTPTPHGEFQIYFKQPLRVAGGETPYRMPYYMAFKDNGEYGLHSLPYLGSDTAGSGLWYEARGHIGIPVSHGCVRLLPETISKLFHFIPVGTPLIIK